MKRSAEFHIASIKKNSNQLNAGVAVIDITPPMEVGLLTSSVRREWKPFESIRAPLKARALTLENGEQRMALVSLDLLGLTSVAVGGWDQFKRALSAGTSDLFQPHQIVLTCVHTHNAPESVGLTNLYRTPQYQHWINELRQKLSLLIVNAHRKARECTLSLATTELNHFSLQRRVPTANGIVMSDSLQPIAPELFLRKPVDRRVRSLLFRGLDGSVIATAVHAICHPVHEMCLPQISPDFPGELCRALKDQPGFGTPLFFNGAAGDVNPPTVSEGAQAAFCHGQAIAKSVTASMAKRKKVAMQNIRFRHDTVKLPIRSMKGKPISGTVVARLSACLLGDLAIVFLPGEIFSETALAIEQASPFPNTIVVGFSESGIGYVPPREVFREGGYEVGPGKWSYLQETAESMLRDAAIALLENPFARTAAAKARQPKISGPPRAFRSSKVSIKIPTMMGLAER